MLRYFSLQLMRRHLTSSCYSMKLSTIMRCVYKRVSIKRGLSAGKVMCSHIFKMSDFKDQLFTCAGLPSDNIVEFSCGKKLF